jgi:CDP-diacylglycerol--glycerol-3-phosphate 3-phosphatidyltransferase
MEILTNGWHALRALPLYELAPLIILPIIWLSGLAYFAIRCAIVGMPNTERIAKTSSKAMPKLLIEFGWWFLNLPVAALLKLRVTPDMVTWGSAALAAGSAVMFGMGHFSAGGWLLAASGAGDTIDGRLARALGTASDRGEYFDAFMDRYADFFVLFGMLYYYRNDPVEALIVCFAIMGTQVMGYAKAKGEAVGIDPKVGFMQRHERTVYMIIGTCLGPILAAFVEPFSPHPRFHLAIATVAVVAVLTNVTAAMRAVYVMKRMPRPEPKFPQSKKSAPTSDEAPLTPALQHTERHA